MADKTTEQPKELPDMSVMELEQESYRLGEEIRALRNQAIEVQGWLSKRNEELRISQLLGRPVQVVDAPTIHSPEESSGSLA